MNSLFVKICGITNYNDALHSYKSGSDAVGFITYNKSKRYIEAAKVAEIINVLNKDYRDKLKVGVFVNENISSVERYIEAGINVVQLHGDEDNDYISRLEKLSVNFQIWKAVRLRDYQELKKVNEYKVDKILIDTFSDEEYGGTGKTGDWELAEYIVKNSNKPVILAGGLNSKNVIDAILKVKPFGIDISSGVESKPGIKNHQFIDKLFHNIELLK